MAEGYYRENLIYALNAVLRDHLGGPISELASDEQIAGFCTDALAYLMVHETPDDLTPELFSIIRGAYVNWNYDKTLGYIPLTD